MYLTQADIADNRFMRLRVAQCAAQEGCADAGIDSDAWTADWKRIWSSAPGWAEAWESALAGTHPPDYDPGKEQAVITDAMILGQVQSMMPFTMVADNKPVP